MVSAWKNYLKWEEGNPLVIEDEEARNQRIGYALRKCLGEMRHFPELWYVEMRETITGLMIGITQSTIMVAQENLTKRQKRPSRVFRRVRTGKLSSRSC